MVCSKLQWGGPSKAQVFDHTTRYAHTGYKDAIRISHPGFLEDQLEEYANEWLNRKLGILTEEMAKGEPESKSTGLLSYITKNGYLKYESREFRESLELIAQGKGVRASFPTF